MENNTEVQKGQKFIFGQEYRRNGSFFGVQDFFVGKVFRVAKVSKVFRVGKVGKGLLKGYFEACYAVGGCGEAECGTVSAQYVGDEHQAEASVVVFCGEERGEDF